MKERTRKRIELVLVLLPIFVLMALGWLGTEGDVGHKVTVLTLSAMVVAVAAGYLTLKQREMAFNQRLFMTMVLMVTGGSCFLLQKTDFLYMPMLIGVMLLAIIIDEQLAVMMHLALVAIVAMVGAFGTVFLLYYGILGVAAGLTVTYAKERHQMLMVVGGLGGFGAVLLALLTYGVDNSVSLLAVAMAFGNTALSIILVIGSLPLWESLFNVTTPLKLLEFASTDHQLMQRLLVEAPGTYHHVQMVGNLAERGAKAIGANALLAKTAAIYHDIGKLKEPGYFIENQNGGPNPHDDIDALDSARIIIEHVTYGVKLAKTHKLPAPITHIIEQHHGTSLVVYFYHKAKGYDDGVHYEEKDFRYPGPKPQTREAAVVMLADCVEAFVRSLPEQDRNLEKIRWIIDTIKRQKFEDGQLDDCGLKISDLKLIGEAFMQVYKGLYHERIAYPENNL